MGIVTDSWGPESPSRLAALPHAVQGETGINRIRIRGVPPNPEPPEQLESRSHEPGTVGNPQRFSLPVL